MPAQTLFVNVRYDNQASLDETYDAMTDRFGRLNWRELLEDVLGHDLSQQADLDEWLDGMFGITREQLEENIPDQAIDRFYSELAFDQDNFTGGAARAFNLIRSLDLFPMDKDGNGGAHGVTLMQTTANGPAKHVFIQDQRAAQWLTEQLRARAIQVEIEYV